MEPAHHLALVYEARDDVAQFAFVVVAAIGGMFALEEVKHVVVSESRAQLRAGLSVGRTRREPLLVTLERGDGKSSWVSLGLGVEASGEPPERVLIEGNLSNAKLTVDGREYQTPVTVVLSCATGHQVTGPRGETYPIHPMPNRLAVFEALLILPIPFDLWAGAYTTLEPSVITLSGGAK